MRVLLIGGSGFIGTVLARRLTERGHDLLNLDLRPSPTREVATVMADIRDREAIKPHFAGRDVVINLAAQHADNVTPVSLYTEVNVGGAENVCAAAEAMGVSRIIFTSSVAVYGETEALMTVDTPPRPTNEYGRTKLAAEGVYRGWFEADAARRLHIIRPTAVFGPGNRGNIYNLLKQIKHGPFLMVGDGGNVKSIAFVDNVAAFIVHVLGMESRFGLFNYADRPDLTVAELISLTSTALGRKSTPGMKLPLPLALSGGRVLDALGRATGRRFPISAVRVRKFVASSIVSSDEARATGFTPAADAHKALAEMIVNHV